MPPFLSRLQQLLPAGGLQASLVQGALWLLALGLSAWVGATLFWRWQAPVSPALSPAPVTDPRAVAEQLANRHPFAVLPNGPTVAPSTGPGRFRLEGLATGFGTGPGFALIAIDGGPAQAVVAGEELAPGIRLARIARDRVELDHGAGPRETLLLPEFAIQGATPATARLISHTLPPGTRPGRP